MPTAATLAKIREFSTFIDTHPGITSPLAAYRTWKTTSGMSLRKETYLRVIRNVRGIKSSYHPELVRRGYKIDWLKVPLQKAPMLTKYRYSVKIGWEMESVTLKNGKTVLRYLRDSKGRKIPAVRDVISDRQLGKGVDEKEIIENAIKRAESSDGKDKSGESRVISTIAKIVGIRRGNTE